MRQLYLFLFLSLSFSAAFAQDATVTWKFDGQVQLRSELDGRDFSNKTYPLAYTYSRVRLGASATVADNVSFYFQAQDSRIFGEETSVSSNQKNLDLHQGYVKLSKLFSAPLSVQAGRFTVNYGDERFFSASEWNYVGKAWDGVRASYGSTWKLDVFALTRKDSTVYQSSADLAKYSYPAKSIYNASVYGAWFTGEIMKDQKIDAFIYHDVTRSKSSNLDYDSLRLTTVGLSHYGTYGDLSSVFDGATQFGANNKRDVLAYLISLQVFYKIDALKVGLGSDLISGSSGGAKGKYYCFETPYNATHRYLGYMDYSFKTPSSKYVSGVNDFYLLSTYTPAASPLTFGLNYHHLNTNKQDDLGNRLLGDEVDLTVKYDIVKGTSVTWGGSAFFAGKALKDYALLVAKNNPMSDTAFWSFLMITANF